MKLSERARQLRDLITERGTPVSALVTPSDSVEGALEQVMAGMGFWIQDGLPKMFTRKKGKVQGKVLTFEGESLQGERYRGSVTFETGWVKTQAVVKLDVAPEGSKKWESHEKIFSHPTNRPMRDLVRQVSDYISSLASASQAR